MNTPTLPQTTTRSQFISRRELQHHACLMAECEKQGIPENDARRRLLVTVYEREGIQAAMDVAESWMQS